MVSTFYLVIVNNTGSLLKILNTKKDAGNFSLTSPSMDTTLSDGKSAQITMASYPFPPNWISSAAVTVSFICKSNFSLGTIYFKEEAIGNHQFSSTGPFSYKMTKLQDGTYEIGVSLT